MLRFRLSGLAHDDLERILATSLERWGANGRERYAALISAALRQIGRAPNGGANVIFYRVGAAIEIVRVLHDRMEPTLHLTKR